MARTPIMLKRRPQLGTRKTEKFNLGRAPEPHQKAQWIAENGLARIGRPQKGETTNYFPIN